MCNFASAVLTRSGDLIMASGDHSHSVILRAHGLIDDHRNIVRLEFVPEAPEYARWQQIGQLLREAWHFRIDQDMVPDWFDSNLRASTEERMWRQIVARCLWAASPGLDERAELPSRDLYWLHGGRWQQVHRGQTVEHVSDTDILKVAGDIHTATGQVFVTRLLDSGHIGSVGPKCVVSSAQGRIDGLLGRVDTLRGRGYISTVSPEAHVDMMEDNATIGLLASGATCRFMWGSANINACHGMIDGMSGSTTVLLCYDGHVKKMSGSATLRVSWGARDNVPAIRVGDDAVIIPATADRLQRGAMVYLPESLIKAANG